MFINRSRRELNLKLVYYGPALSGKTTNLQYIHANTNPKLRGELVTLNTRDDRTLFFDFLQMELGQVNGFKPKFNLYTVPGQAYYAATRKLVLQGVDGVVFVADSHAGRLKDNLAALHDLQTYLRGMGHDPDAFPLVVQFNKRDLPEAVPVPVLRQYLRLDGATPHFPAVAINGQGVLDTLRAIIGRVIRQVQGRL